jgi:hypothetical protein
MRPGRRIVVRIVASGLVVAALVVAGIAIWAARGKKTARASLCQVNVGSSKYVIDLAQAANATTIAAIGKRLDVPDHAVTIALATALQESQLHNLAYGDRDSLGLFQQRPSQGWGTAAQIMNPRYAAAAFFTALERIPSWQTMPVTEAAQAVQHSDAPQAYASWEPLARALAIATTGETAAGLASQFSPTRSNTTPASPLPALTTELGPSGLGVPVTTARGWTIATWLVAHADQYRITTIHFAGRQWTPRGVWTATADHATGVRITQASTVRE